MNWRRVGLTVLGPAAALLVAFVISSAVLFASGHNAFSAYWSMLRFAKRTDSMISILNRSTPLYFSALAVAIGFKMGLFNIGVNGQYQIAALLAAAAGAAVTLPAVLHVPFILIVGVGVGAGWAGIAGVLRVTRGVHEVISTIMLNAIATGVSAYLLQNYLREESRDLVIKTKAIPPSGLIPSLNRPLEALGVDVPDGSSLQGFIVIAVVAGAGYWILLFRTRFGYDLRATGVNPLAAGASGVNANAMVIRTMLLSGGIAGLVGMSQLLGFFGRYTIDFPSQFGFVGIAVALLGRNHPVGIALGALLFAFLDRSAQILDLEGVPKEIVVIMQGIIILTVVIAYEVVRRVAEAHEVHAAADAARSVSAAEATA